MGFFDWFKKKTTNSPTPKELLTNGHYDPVADTWVYGQKQVYRGVKPEDKAINIPELNWDRQQELAGLAGKEFVLEAQRMARQNYMKEIEKRIAIANEQMKLWIKSEIERSLRQIGFDPATGHVKSWLTAEIEKQVRQIHEV